MHEVVANDNCCLRIEDATYCYDGEMLPVWQHLSCCFQKGKINAICGPSGCGKSSILNLIDGLIPHMYEGDFSGKIIFDEEDISDLYPRYRCGKIGYVMQNPESQFTTFTVEEELAFGMENLCVPPDEMNNRIRKALEFVGMTGFEKTNLDDLSGGQKQKIAIASVIVTKPQVLLLDEPTANLDPGSRKQIFDLILRLSREHEMTIILVEHNIDEIIDSVDWMIVLDSTGNIRLQDNLQENRVAFNRLLQHDNDEVMAVDCSKDETVLEIQNLRFSYPTPGAARKKAKKNEHSILQGIDLQIRKQEFFAIVGENGVGKTTLMRLVFQIFKPDKGTIHLFGRPIESYRKRELYHQIGLVFQNPENQFITNTVWDEMMFSLRRVKIPEEEKEQRVMTMLQRFHLEQDKEKSPFVLSQGQKRRLSVASMLLTNQQILFLDEPTYGQDFENRQELMKDMQKLVAEGITIVMVTHDMSLVKQYATRVARIEDGIVVKCLPTEEFFDTEEQERKSCLPI
jgi:energy-coupling factor transport system ATP-binding protein